MTCPETPARPCAAKTCTNKREPNSSYCRACGLQKKTAARRARERLGLGERTDPEAAIRQLLAFPEPAKYLALVREICKPRAADRRTISGRLQGREYPALEFEMEDKGDDC